MADRIVRICNRIIEYSFYLLFFLAPLIFTSWNYELFEFNKMMLTYFLTVTIVGAFVMKSVLQGELRIVRTPLDIPILLFLASLVISTAYSIDLHTSIWGYYSRFNGGLVSIISYLVLYYVFVSTLEVKKTYRLLLVSMASGFVVTLWGLPSHFGFDPTCFLFQGTFDTSCWTEQFRPEIRIFSTLGQPNWLAAYLSILIPLSLALGLTSFQSMRTSTAKMESGKWKVENFKKYLPSTFYLLLSIVLYLALLYTKSRSGLAGLSIGLAVFVFGYFWLNQQTIRNIVLKKVIRTHWYLLVALVLIGSITFVVGTSFEQLNKFTLEGIRSRLPTTNDQRLVTEPQGPALETGGTESGEIRKIVWQGAIDIAKHYPLFGSGVETFAYSYYQFRPTEHNLTSEWDFLYNKAHNEYLNYLATTGFVGLGSYLLMIGVFLFYSFKQITNYKFLISNQIPSTKSQLGQLEIRSIRNLTLALIASFLSILASNFFGFSVVITNLYLFLIPAFVFILNGTIDPQKAFLLPQPKTYNLKPTTTIAVPQWITAAGILLTTIFLLLNIIRFWFADTKYAQGFNLDRQGLYASAYEPLFLALQLRPDEPTFQDELAANMASLATFFGTEDATSSSQLVQNAITLSDDIVRKNPNNVTFWKSRTRIFYTLSEIDQKYLAEAIASIEKARSLAPTDAKIAYNLAVLYGQNEQIDQAIQMLDETIKLKPDYRDAYYALGLFYNEKGDRTRAIEQMEFILNKVATSDAEAKERLTEWRGF